jgi:hypothetical protein
LRPDRQRIGFPLSSGIDTIHRATLPRRIALMRTWKQSINLLFTEEILNHLVEW